MKRAFAALLMLWLFVTGMVSAAAEETKVVFRAGEAAPFAADSHTLDLYVAPLQGADCMLLTDGSHSMLVDMGREKDYEIIKAWLTDLGITHIDIAFNTHPHDDHIGAMKALLNDFSFDTFMTAFPDNFTGMHIIQPSVLRAVREKGIEVKRVHNGDVFHLGNDATFFVICMNKHSEVNQCSAMLRVVYGRRSLLLAADVIGWSQKKLAENNNLKADVLKFPHHGLSPVMMEFLENVSPEYTVFTHGYANTKRSQQQMDKYGIDYDFATWGPIHLSTDGTYWLVEQTLTDEGIQYAQKYK